MDIFYEIPTKIILGNGKINELSSIKLPGKRVLVIISNSEYTGKIIPYKLILNLLKENIGIDKVVVEEIKGNNKVDAIFNCSSIVSNNNCDIIVAIGGGKVIDVAKGVSILSQNPKEHWNYILSAKNNKKLFKKTQLPLITIPTTSSTGTEANSIAIVSNNTLNEKLVLNNHKLFPYLTIIDPDLMLTIPKELTLYQGFNILFNGVESYISSKANELSSIYSLKAIDIVVEALESFIKNADDNIVYRESLALGSLLNGLNKSTSASTSLSAIGTTINYFYPDIQIGAALLIIYKEYFKFHRETLSAKFKNITKYNNGDIISFIEKLQKESFKEDISMSSYGVKKSSLKEIALNARDTMGHLFYNDEKQLSLQDTIEILENSYS